MDEVGIAYILEKKEYTIDGEKRPYYEIVDCALGFFYKFNNSGNSFVCLTGKFAGRSFSEDNKDSKYITSDFKSLNTLSNENRGLYDLEKFIKTYRDEIKRKAKYFIFDGVRKFDGITDEKIIRIIEGIYNDYGELSLDNSDDIEKIHSVIKKTVISQDEQIMEILMMLFKNQKIINSSLSNDMILRMKEHAFVFGESGIGKSEIFKRISKVINVSMVIVDVTTLSLSCDGKSVEDILKDLYSSTNNNLEKAQKGIIVLDCFDKLTQRKSTSEYRVEYGNEVIQKLLLELFEGKTYYFDDIKFDTSKLTIVGLGNFTEIINGHNYMEINRQSFTNYGVIPNLMRYFSKFISMNSLTKEDIKKILKESDLSPINTYKQLFESMNIKFSYDDTFIDYIAEMALKLDNGAWGIEIAFNEVMSEIIPLVFDGDYVEINLTRPKGTGKTYILTKRR